MVKYGTMGREQEQDGSSSKLEKGTKAGKEGIPSTRGSAGLTLNKV